MSGFYVYAPLNGFLPFLAQGWSFADLVVEPMAHGGSMPRSILLWMDDL